MVSTLQVFFCHRSFCLNFAHIHIVASLPYIVEVDTSQYQQSFMGDFLWHVTQLGIIRTTSLLLFCKFITLKCIFPFLDSFCPSSLLCFFLFPFCFFDFPSSWFSFLYFCFFRLVVLCPFAVQFSHNEAKTCPAFTSAFNVLGCFCDPWCYP